MRSSTVKLAEKVLCSSCTSIGKCMNADLAKLQHEMIKKHTFETALLLLTPTTLFSIPFLLHYTNNFGIGIMLGGISSMVLISTKSEKYQEIVQERAIWEKRCTEKN